jgi:hypothetical protein
VPVSPPTDARPDAPPDARRPALDAALRPFALGTHAPGDEGAALTERRIAAAARDAAAAVVPLLGEPPRSAHRVRRLLRAVLTCTWAEFEATYAHTLDALLALPPALPDVEDPAWDAHLGGHRKPEPRRGWRPGAPPWTAPVEGAATTGPAGTVGRVVRRGARAVLVTADGRNVRANVRCACGADARGARPDVPFELVHLRRDGAILDVVVGTACGSCRGALADAEGPLGGPPGALSPAPSGAR